MNEFEKIVKDLKSLGYVICVWAPEELGDLDPKSFQDEIYEFGNELLEDLGIKWSVRTEIKKHESS
jgi:hypothetical protein